MVQAPQEVFRWQVGCSKGCALPSKPGRFSRITLINARKLCLNMGLNPAWNLLGRVVFYRISGCTGRILLNPVNPVKDYLWLQESAWDPITTHLSPQRNQRPPGSHRERLNA